MFRVQRRVDREFQLVRFCGSEAEADEYVFEYEMIRKTQMCAFERRMAALWGDDFYMVRPELYMDVLSVVEIEGEQRRGWPVVEGPCVELDDYEIDRRPWWALVVSALFRLVGLRC